jgi:hypothetical protein
MENARARDRTCTFAPAKKTSCTIGVNGLPTASALPAPTERSFGMSRFKGQLLANIHSRSVFAEGQQWLKEAFSMCQEFRHEIPLRLQRADSALRNARPTTTRNGPSLGPNHRSAKAGRQSQSSLIQNNSGLSQGLGGHSGVGCAYYSSVGCWRSLLGGGRPMSDIRRRDFIALVRGTGLLLAAKVGCARAQQPAIPVIGFINSASPDLFVTFVRAFHQGLGETGHVEGRNVAIEYRWAHGQYNRMLAMGAAIWMHIVRSASTLAEFLQVLNRPTCRSCGLRRSSYSSTSRPPKRSDSKFRPPCSPGLTR